MRIAILALLLSANPSISFAYTKDECIDFSNEVFRIAEFHHANMFDGKPASSISSFRDSMNSRVLDENDDIFFSILEAIVEHDEDFRGMSETERKANRGYIGYQFYQKCMDGTL